MNNQTRENLVNDIENRLDDFFDEGLNEPPAEPEKVSLQQLKSVILSIDWEITEACLDDLAGETSALMPRFEHDRLSFTLLRMLRAVGEYIRKRKARSHPDAIKRIMSVFNSLEEITSANQPDEGLKKMIVAKEIAAFKKLKEQVGAQRKPPSQTTEAENDSEDGAHFVDHHKLEAAVNAVEKRLNSQVTELKTQLKTLQDELDRLRSR